MEGLVTECQSKSGGGDAVDEPWPWAEPGAEIDVSGFVREEMGLETEVVGLFPDP